MNALQNLHSVPVRVYLLSIYPTPSQNAQLYHLLEYRCNRYFFVESAGTFLPVPPIPRAFNEQLQRSSHHVAAGGAPRDHPGGLDWDLRERYMRYAGLRGILHSERHPWRFADGALLQMSGQVFS